MTPTTAFVTFLRYGDEGVEVVYTNGEKEYVALEKLSTVSSEIELDEQLRTKEIERVNVNLPQPLLKTMTIVDSPGLNSLHVSHTKQTNQMLKEATNEQQEQLEKEIMVIQQDSNVSSSS